MLILMNFVLFYGAFTEIEACRLKTIGVTRAVGGLDHIFSQVSSWANHVGQARREISSFVMAWRSGSPRRQR